MTYDLRFEPWIPWRRRSGAVSWGTVSGLLAELGTDPVVGIASPRPDFDAALTEFLIGLLSMALTPADETAWRAAWNAPPSVEELEQRLRSLPPAFDLDGEGPRFLQDHDRAAFEATEVVPVDQLLIDSPGEQTLKNNTDLFVKRSRVQRLGRPAAAMALLTLQTYAPSGGKGHRTSLRGGGPLTSIVAPPVPSPAEPTSFWRVLWANVVTVETWQSLAPRRNRSAAEPELLFPWLAPTRTSQPKTGRTTTPADAHPLQAFVGMPRRLRLEFEDGARCDLTGLSDTRTVTGFRRLGYGVEYDGWMHPLSPHYRQRADQPWLPVHGQPGGVGWRDWRGLTSLAEDPEHVPALTVAHFLRRRAPALGMRRISVDVFGFDVDNMKCRGWVEAVLPAFVVDDPELRQRLEILSRRCVEGAEVAAQALRWAVRQALFGQVEEIRGEVLDDASARFWADTQAPFFGLLQRAIDDAASENALQGLATGFCAEMERVALSTFDQAAPLAAEPRILARLVRARYGLQGTLRGFGPVGHKLYRALAIAEPSKAKAKRTRTSGKEKKAHD